MKDWKQFRFLCITILLLFAITYTAVYAVGTLTQLNSTSKLPYRRVTLTWTATAGGAVSGINTGYINGKIVGVVIDPGTPAPTTLYDIVILNSNGFDVLAAQGANLSATVTTQVVPGVPFKDGTTTSVAPAIVHGPLELQVSNAGSGGAGVVVLLLE